MLHNVTDISLFGWVGHFLKNMKTLCDLKSVFRTVFEQACMIIDSISKVLDFQNRPVLLLLFLVSKEKTGTRNLSSGKELKKN